MNQNLSKGIYFKLTLIYLLLSIILLSCGGTEIKVATGRGVLNEDGGKITSTEITIKAIAAPDVAVLENPEVIVFNVSTGEDVTEALSTSVNNSYSKSLSLLVGTTYRLTVQAVSNGTPLQQTEEITVSSSPQTVSFTFYVGDETEQEPLPPATTATDADLSVISHSLSVINDTSCYNNNQNQVKFNFDLHSTLSDIAGFDSSVLRYNYELKILSPTDACANNDLIPCLILSIPLMDNPVNTNDFSRNVSSVNTSLNSVRIKIIGTVSALGSSNISSAEVTYSTILNNNALCLIASPSR